MGALAKILHPQDKDMLKVNGCLRHPSVPSKKKKVKTPVMEKIVTVYFLE
jgi:hypothetical protein